MRAPTPTLDALFAVPAALPVVPQVVQRLVASFQREDVSIEEISQQIAADPVLCAKTLRLANSAYFHVSRQIATVDDALRMLGFVMMRNVVLSIGLNGVFKAVPGLDLHQFWRFSAHTACVARWLAQTADEGEAHNADLGFTVGLMHGLGQLVMHAAMPGHMSALNERCHPLALERAELEAVEFGYHHGNVGTELALRWRFPAAVASPLSQVPSEPARAAQGQGMADLVRIAAWRARQDVLRLSPEAAKAAFPAAAAHRVGLRPDVCETMPPLAELSGGLVELLAA